jgi:hypothetical protein
LHPVFLFPFLCITKWIASYIKIKSVLRRLKTFVSFLILSVYLFSLYFIFFPSNLHADYKKCGERLGGDYKMIQKIANDEKT